MEIDETVPEPCRALGARETSETSPFYFFVCNNMDKVFTYGGLASKLVILIVLLALAYRNVDTEFVSKNPRFFMTESILTGLAISLPLFLVLHNRGIGFINTLSPLIVSFLLFFVYNVLLEISGQNEASFVDSNKLLKYAAVTSMVVLLLISLVMHDFTPSFGIIAMETIFTACMGAIVEFWKARNRGHDFGDAGKKFLFYFGMFAGFHLVLQFGGVFTKISNPLITYDATPPPTI